MWFQVADNLSAEDLGLHGKVLEQSVSHHDHCTYRSLSW